MTTNELIDLIRNAHLNADCLAQIASAVESMREEVAEDGDRCDGCERGCDACNDGQTGDDEPSDEGADAEWLASAGWGTDEDYE